eukprot:8127254-Pyramimonas_sp.AAC.1
MSDVHWMRLGCTVGCIQVASKLRLSCHAMGVHDDVIFFRTDHRRTSHQSEDVCTLLGALTCALGVLE